MLRSEATAEERCQARAWKKAMPDEDVFYSQYCSFAYVSGFVEAAPVSAMMSQWRPQAEHRHSLTIPVGK
jgi:hypothetical protein